MIGFGHARGLAVVVQAGSAGYGRSAVHIRHKTPALARVQPARGAVRDQTLALCIRRPIRCTPTTGASMGEQGAVSDAGVRDGKMPAQFPGTAIESLDGTSVPRKTGGTVSTGNAGSPRLPRGRGVAAAVDPNGCQGRVEGSKGGQRQCVGLLHVQAGGRGEWPDPLGGQGDQVLAWEPVLMVDQSAQACSPGGRALHAVGQPQEQAGQGFLGERTEGAGQPADGHRVAANRCVMHGPT